MELIDRFLTIIQGWRGAFSQQRTYLKAKRQALSMLGLQGRHTISQTIIFAGREQRNWNPDYRLHSRAKWNPKALFAPVRQTAVGLAAPDHVVVAYDDSQLAKSGRKIPQAKWQRDPLSPRFRANLIWGQRFLQSSLVLPLYRNEEGAGPRGIPTHFELLAVIPKQKKGASPEQKQACNDARKTGGVSARFVSSLQHERKALDQAGARQRVLVAVADGHYCNRDCLSHGVERTVLVARTRKDGKLCFKDGSGGRRFYAKQTFTPEAVRCNDEIPWNTANVFHGKQWRNVRYKDLPELYWRGSTRRLPLRLIVVAPTPYRTTKKGKLYYRDAAYLLCTSSSLPAAVLLQAYFDRWEIEVNIKDEKDVLGLGDSQVRTQASAERQPALLVAAYSAIVLAALLQFGFLRNEHYFALPKWRTNPVALAKPRRPSLRDIIKRLQWEISQHPRQLETLGMFITNCKKTISIAA